MSFGFVFHDFIDETSISQFFVSWYRRFLFEEYGVSAVNLVANTFSKSAELVGKGFFPNFFFVALHEVAILLGLTGDWVSDGVCLRDCNVVCRSGVLG